MLDEIEDKDYECISAKSGVKVPNDGEAYK